MDTDVRFLYVYLIHFLQKMSTKPTFNLPCESAVDLSMTFKYSLIYASIKIVPSSLKKPISCNMIHITEECKYLLLDKIHHLQRIWYSILVHTIFRCLTATSYIVHSLFIH